LVSLKDVKNRELEYDELVAEGGMHRGFPIFFELGHKRVGVDLLGRRKIGLVVSAIVQGH
jgi:hypothetical protein